MNPEMLKEAVSFPKERIQVEISAENVMSVMIPKIQFMRSGEDEASIYPYGFTETSAELDEAMLRLHRAMDRLLELAALEKACQLMANEIEKSRRRVNTLEYSRNIKFRADTKRTFRRIFGKI